MAPNGPATPHPPSRKPTPGAPGSRIFYGGPFETFTETRAYESAKRKTGALRASRVRAGTAGKKKKAISIGKKQQILVLLAQGLSFRQIAKTVKVAASSVKRVLDDVNGGGVHS